MRHIIPISGKDSLATAIVQNESHPEFQYEYIFCDMGMELPDTYEWIDKVELNLNIKIHRIGKSFQEIIESKNMLPSAHRRFCTSLGKIYPITEYIGNVECVQYIGIRYDESHRTIKDDNKNDNIEYEYPLIRNKIDINGVRKIVAKCSAVPPSFFWERLHDEVLGRTSPNSDIVAKCMASGLFSWRTRSNCLNCFFQRRYEWVGLLEHYPNLFEKAMEIETRYGTGDRRPCHTVFSYIKGMTLGQLQKKAEVIFEKRVKHICGIIHDMQQTRMFELPTIESMDPLSLTSCGIYCGK